MAPTFWVLTNMNVEDEFKINFLLKPRAERKMFLISSRQTNVHDSTQKMSATCPNKSVSLVKGKSLGSRLSLISGLFPSAKFIGTQNYYYY